MELLYGIETWATIKTEEKGLIAFETRCYSRLLRISWTENITKEGNNQKVRKTSSFPKT